MTNDVGFTFGVGDTIWQFTICSIDGGLFIGSLNDVVGHYETPYI